MLGRRKKRTGSTSSVDLLALSSAGPLSSTGAPVDGPTAPSRMYNFILDRARGAVTFGGARARTTSDDGASVSPGAHSHLSSSPTGSVKNFFGSQPTSGAGGATSSAAGAGGAGGGGGASSAGSSTPFFRRTPALSNPIRPGWLVNKDKDTTRTGSPLTTSPSTPAGLSTAAADQRRKDKTVLYPESGKKLAAISQSSTDLGSLLPPAANKNFSRSVEDLSRGSRLAEVAPPMPLPSHGDRRPSTDDSGRTTIRNKRSTSLQPLNGVLSPSPSPPSPNLLATSPLPNLLSTSAPPSRGGSRSPSPSAHRIPFPTSASSPDFTSPVPSTTSTLGSDRRHSQTILCEGYLQRKVDYAPPSSPKPSPSLSSHSHSHSNSPSLPAPSHSPLLHARAASPLLRAKSDVDLQKGWKPYRAVLKGSKLYLHKLPGDLTNTAKHLFPTTLVEKPASPGPSSARSFDAAGAPTDDGAKRKVRVFWGTGSSSHPGLVTSGKGKGKEHETVTGGTLEALVHELVFGTTFVAPRKPQVDASTTPSGEAEASPEDDAALDPEEAERLYDEFLETLLLAAPALGFPASQLASELDRCTGLAVRTAHEAAVKDPAATPTALADRLEKIVRLVCDKFSEDLRTPSGGNGGPSVWRTAVDEVIRQLKTLPTASAEPRDTAALEQLVNDAGADLPGRSGSPVTEWAPPPGQTTIRRPPTSLSNSPTKTRKRLLPAEPELSTFMSTTSFLATDPVAFASQVHLFHLDRLAGISGQSSSPRHILRAAAVFLVADPAARASALTPLFAFGPTSPHFLTRIVLNTILPGSTSAPSAHPSPALLFAPPPAPETRVAVISRWIAVGEELKRRGDTAGWAAVATAICSRAVSRLEETWRMIDSELVGTVRREWALSLSRIGFADLDDATIRPLAFSPPVTDTGVPYLGSVLEDASAALRLAKLPSEEQQPGAVNLVALYPLRDRLDDVEAVWTRTTPAAIDVRPEPELQLFFQLMSRNVLPPRPQLSAYLPASLEVEPRPPAQHLSLHFKPRSVHEPSPLIPLLMVEPLPHLTLVDRDKIIQSAAGSLPRKHSGTNLNGVPAHIPSAPPRGAPPGRLVRHNSYPPSAASTGDRPGVFARLRNEIAHPSETLLRFADGDIVFRIVSAALPTMPAASTSNERGVLSRTSSWVESRSSRASSRSIRASTSSAGRALSPLSRSPSQNAIAPTPGSESPPIKLQVAGEAEPVDVVVKAGTVESLVDLLVLGIGNLRTPSTDADGESSLTGKRPLALDMDEYRSSFFATFRAFSSPLAVLDMLRKRYLAAPNASKEYVNLSSQRPFPSWSMIPSSDGEELDWKRISAIRLAVLENVQHWVEHQLGDFLDDDDLFTSTATFLSFVESTERLALEERPHAEDDAEAVLDLAKWLRVRFTRLSLRPVVRPRNVLRKDSDKASDPTLSFDGLSVGELVDRLDRIACGVTAEVTEHDILRYLDILESSSLADPAAWYSTRQLAKTDDDDVVIADPYSHLLALGAEPAAFRGMPFSLQHGLKVHATIRRWILCHLVDPDLSLHQRQARMTKALEMIEVSRSRMSNVFFGGQVEANGSILEPSLASFVERATTSAIVSPESRLFASAWAGVAAARQASAPDTLAALVKPTPIMTDASATLDLAWLNERLVEIATQVDSLAEGISINFEKRRWIFNCIQNALAIRPSQSGVAAGSDSLAQIERRLAGWGNWGVRVLRDVASGEGNKVTKAVRPFRRLVDQQQDKIRRDRQTRDHVSKGQKAEQLGRLQREKEVARAMDKSVSVRTRRMTAIFRAVRPVSTMTPSSPVPVASPSPSALQALHEWAPTTKPYLVLALSGVEVMPYDNLQRSFVFELGTEDGQRSLLQAATFEDQQMWISNFRRSGTQIAFRRATFLAQSPLAEEVEEAISPRILVQQPPASTAVFGVPLHILVAREGTSLPVFVEKALEIVEERGLSEVGIYRISGENRLILDTKEQLNRGGDPSKLLTFDVHNVSGLVKMFLRELPDSLIPFNFYDGFLGANGIDDYDDRLYALRDLVWKLPAPNFLLLRRLTEHLDRVTDNEDVNAMHAANLSIIFAPTLLRAPPGPASFGLSMTNLGKAANIIKSLILRSAWIFGEETDGQVDESELPLTQELDEDPEVEVLQDEVALFGLGLDVPVTHVEDPAAAESVAEESTDESDPTDASGSDRAVVDYRASIDVSRTPDAATPAESSPISELPAPIDIPAAAMPATLDEIVEPDEAEDASSESEEEPTTPPPLPTSLAPLSLPSPITATFLNI